METAAGARQTPTNGKGDLFFKCEHCGVSLVVDCAAAGMTLKCQHCAKLTTVSRSSSAHGPAGLSTPGHAERWVELQRHLKENESQRTEVNGYINQLNIQLHRWQLRLQTLNERNKELTREFAGLGAADNPELRP